MKKTLVFEYEIMGSVQSWGVEVFLSRTKNSGEWTVDFNYTDPEALDSETHTAESAEDFLNIAEERYLDLDSFCDALKETKKKELITLASEIQNAVLIIVGDGDVVSQLKTYVSDNQLDSKVLFFDKRPYQEMMNYTFYADLGLTLDKPTNINYRFSLPNKVFDYIHAETPILSTDLVEIASILKKYDVGEIISDFTPSNLALQITSLLENEERLSELKHNCIKAKETLNWETETEILKEIYPAIED